MREALIQARNTKRLTQEQIAAAGNISTRQYRKIEANKTKPNVETAISIAKHLDCNVTDSGKKRRFIRRRWIPSKKSITF